jgi:cellulose biosynthesis protein BcsQ
LLAANASLGSLWAATRPLGQRLSRSDLAPAFYELALFEDRLLVEWLVQQGGDDVHYRLAKVLLQDAIKDKYDVVLIDVPPRMTTGTMNALCTATHVLIPAIFNSLADEPVENFLTTSKALMNELNPRLKFLGVLETMSPKANEGQDVRADGRRVISEALQRFNPAITILKSHVPRRAAFAEGVAYLKNGREGSEARTVFDALGEEIRGRVARRTRAAQQATRSYGRASTRYRDPPSAFPNARLSRALRPLARARRRASPAPRQSWSIRRCSRGHASSWARHGSPRRLVIGVAPLFELPHTCLQHLIGVEARVLPEHHLREARDERLGRVAKREMARDQPSGCVDLPLAIERAQQSRADFLDRVGKSMVRYLRYVAA